MLNFFICDDNQKYSNELNKMLEKIFVKNDYLAKVIHVSNFYDEAQDYIQNNSKNIDVAIFDIDLHNASHSGLDLANKLRDLNNFTYIIFLTGNIEYTLSAYQFKTFDYLCKPVSFEKLEESLERLFNDANQNTIKFIKIPKKNILINADTLLFIQKEGMKSVYCTTTINHEVFVSFTKISETLPDNFIRCHKSYIVNKNLISSVDLRTNTISFKNSNIHCYVGPKYKDYLMEVLNTNGSNNAVTIYAK